MKRRDFRRIQDSAEDVNIESVLTSLFKIQETFLNYQEDHPLYIHNRDVHADLVETLVTFDSWDCSMDDEFGMERIHNFINSEGEDVVILCSYDGDLTQSNHLYVRKDLYSKLNDYLGCPEYSIRRLDEDFGFTCYRISFINLKNFCNRIGCLREWKTVMSELCKI